MQCPEICAMGCQRWSETANRLCAFRRYRLQCCKALASGGACGAGAPAITSEAAYIMPLAAPGFWGSAGCPPSLCERFSSIQILSIQTASTAEHDFGEFRLHYNTPT